MPRNHNPLTPLLAALGRSTVLTRGALRKADDETIVLWLEHLAYRVAASGYTGKQLRLYEKRTLDSVRAELVARLGKGKE